MSKLSWLYKQLPKIKCPKGCVDCCSRVFMLPSEAQKLNLDHNYTKAGAKGKCGELCTDDQIQLCRNYENRPFICRFFGTVKTGDYSCTKVLSKDSVLLDESEAGKLLEDYMMTLIKTNNMPGKYILEEMNKHDAKEFAKGNLMKRDTLKAGKIKRHGRK